MNENNVKKLTVLNGIALKIVTLFAAITLLFSGIGLMTTAKPAYRLSSPLLSEWTSHFDEHLFLLLMHLESHSLAHYNKQYMETPSITHELFKRITNIRLNDMTSLLGQEIPGFSMYEQTIIIAGEGMSDRVLSYESSPPLDDVLQDHEAISDDKSEQVELVEDKKYDGLTTGDKRTVFLYSTHNRESFLPHLKGVTDPNQAHHDEVNITKVSERLKQSLDAKGIGSDIDKTDVMQVLKNKGWTYGKSYAASRPIVEDALSTNKDIQYIFDIHRDSLPRDKTTKAFDGQDYAKLLFVIGAENASYEKNLKLASTLHYLIDEDYPGLSRGVITKEGAGTNGVFNQDLSENALLIEVGGYDNHLDELYRTIDILADVFADYYWDAEAVNKGG